MAMQDVARELVAGCREGRETENLDKLYAPDAVSVEAVDMGGQGARRRAATRSAASMNGGKAISRSWRATSPTRCRMAMTGSR